MVASSKASVRRDGLVERVDHLASQAERAADALARRAANLAKARGFVDLFGFAAGLAAFAVSISPELRVFLGEQAATAIVAVSSIVLVAGIVAERRLFADPPERFRDYAYYLAQYASTMRNLLANARGEGRQAKLEALVDLCADNLSDCRAKWPDLVPLSSRPAD